MNDSFASELARLVAPALQEEVAVQPILPLQIKLHLERMKLMELIRSAHEKKSRTFLTPSHVQAEAHVAC